MPSGYKFTSTSHVMTASQLLKFYRVIAAAFKGGTLEHNDRGSRITLGNRVIQFSRFHHCVIVSSWDNGCAYSYAQAPSRIIIYFT